MASQDQPQADTSDAPIDPATPTVPGQDTPGLTMPGDVPAQTDQLPPEPASFTKQAVQLVAIPAIIVAVCVGMAVLFGVMAGASDSLDNHLLKLRQHGGLGKLPFGLQDPRHKDRWLAAYNIATMIPSVKRPAQRLRLSQELADILEHNVTEHEPILRAYLMLAVGQLGQPGGIDLLRQGMLDKRPHARHGAVSAVLSWPNRDEVKALIPDLVVRLDDDHTTVISTAAAVLGQIAGPHDHGVVPALHTVLDTTDPASRDARWNAAIALARMDDTRGAKLVATVLLDREELSHRLTDQNETRDQTPGQDRVILSVLTVADSMTDPRVWAKIKALADSDTNRNVRKVAKQLIMTRQDASQ